MPVRRITDGVYQLRHGRINAWLVSHGGMAVLIDCGLPAHGSGLLAMLQELGVEPRALAALLLTHCHLDHAGAARRIHDDCQAEVFIHGADAAAVEGRARLSPASGLAGLLVEPLIARLDGPVFGFRPCPVTAVADGFRHLDFQLIHLPGHTPGHACYFHEPSGVAFCRDAAVNWGVSLSGPSRLFSMDWEQVRLSQLRLSELDADWYCFGHGPPLRRGAVALRRLAEKSGGPTGLPRGDDP